jgi:methionyl aminopeptidase
MDISIKTEEQIKIMREGGKKLASIMQELEKNIRPGENTLELDKLAEKLVFNSGGRPAFKGFGGEGKKAYPATICASINDEVVHGIPTENKILRTGDIFKIDIGMEYQGFFLDMARSFLIGNADEKARKLLEVAEESFWQGIKYLKAGKKLSDYSKAVQKYVEKNGFSVVRNLVGHGIGKKLHEDPQIPNYYNKKYVDIELKKGMALALEPMINAGNFETVLDKDGWTYKTQDGKWSSHYENTILITKDGTEVLTKV